MLTLRRDLSATTVSASLLLELLHTAQRSVSPESLVHYEQFRAALDQNR